MTEYPQEGDGGKVSGVRKSDLSSRIKTLLRYSLPISAFALLFAVAWTFGVNPEVYTSPARPGLIWSLAVLAGALSLWTFLGGVTPGEWGPARRLMRGRRAAVAITLGALLSVGLSVFGGALTAEVALEDALLDTANARRPLAVIPVDSLVQQVEILMRQDPLTNVATIIEAGSRLLAPLAERVSSPLAEAVDIAGVFMENLAEAAGNEIGKQAVGRLFGLLDADSAGGLLPDSTQRLGSAEGRARRLGVDEGVVYFELGGAVVPISGQATISRLVARGRPSSAAWLLIGSTDRSGPEASNESLAKDRIDAVAAYLTARGASPALIFSEALSELASPIPGMDGQKDPGKRQTLIVRIAFGQN